MSLANQLTLIRLVAVVPVMVALYLPFEWARPVAVVLYVAAILTDYFDGIIARRNNEVMGVRFTGMIAAVFWRMAYLVRLNSPQSKVRIAADWIVGIFLRPAVTQIRGTSEE